MNTRSPRSWPSETAEIEVGEQPPDLCAQVPLEVRGLDSGDIEAAHLGQVEHAVAVDRAAVVDVDRAPDTRDDLVARSDRVVGRDRHVVERVEGVGGVGEELLAEDRQQPPGRPFDEALEFVRLRRRRPLEAARQPFARLAPVTAVAVDALIGLPGARACAGLSWLGRRIRRRPGGVGRDRIARRPGGHRERSVRIALVGRTRCGGAEQEGEGQERNRRAARGGKK